MRWDRQALGFAVFCLLAGSRWLADEAFPSRLPTLEAESLHDAVIALAAWGFLVVRTPPVLVRRPRWMAIAAAGLLLLGVPSLLAEAAGAVSSVNGAALFAMAPLFVVVGVAAGASGARALMTPALIGLTGALLMLPFQLPTTGAGALRFAEVVSAVVCVAGGSIWLHRLLQGNGTVPAVAMVCGVNAVLLAAAAFSTGRTTGLIGVLPVELGRCVALDVPQICLLVWLVRDMPPARLASRFLIAPLVAALEGMAMLHPAIDVRMGAGLLLLFAGSAGLLLMSGNDEPMRLRLRG